jgi:formate dehydrogenase iron-sulfur subunit
MAKKRMLIDMSKCIACKACQIACQQWHQLPAEDTSFTGSYQNPEDLSVANLTLTRFSEVGNNGDLRWLFFVDRCRHCEDPQCKEACPLNAIKVNKKGMVFIKAKCSPTKKDPTDVVRVDYCSDNDVKPCQLACPFKRSPDPALGIPRYRLNNGDTLPDGRTNKCDFCYDRWTNTALKAPPFAGVFAKSKKSACEIVCPTGAIKTGGNDKMRRKARRRVKYLQANGYPNANVYPAEYQTQVIWVLLDEPSVYGIVGPY